jgi:hypothetical protein
VNAEISQRKYNYLHAAMVILMRPSDLYKQAFLFGTTVWQPQSSFRSLLRMVWGNTNRDPVSTLYLSLQPDDDEGLHLVHTLHILRFCSASNAWWYSDTCEWNIARHTQSGASAAFPSPIFQIAGNASCQLSA